MKPSILLLLFVVLALTGGAGLLYFQVNLPDNDGMMRDVNERLLKIDSLDSSVSELALRSRIRLDQNYDGLVAATQKLDKSVAELEENYFSDSSIKDSILEKRFLRFKNELALKTELVESFKSHNSVLRNSEKYVPIVGRRLINVAKAEGANAQADLFVNIVISAQEYSQQGLVTDTDTDSLKALLQKISATEKILPEDSLSDLIEFANHLSTVIDEKEQTDGYLTKVLSSTADARLEDLFVAWGEWLVTQDNLRSTFQLLTLVYVGLLLILTGLITLALRALYRSLDQQVAKRTAEVKLAYDELQKSEKQLMQSEKMASLGQLVAGVAHGINTPLGYLSNNVDIIKSGLGDIQELLDITEMLSKEAGQASVDKKVLSQLLVKIVKAHRALIAKETVHDISGLLNDSAYGLNEILLLVESLKNFSRPDSANMTLANIHEGLEATMKICANVIGGRRLKKVFAEDLPEIECIPAQLNQAFMNVLTNAAQATDEQNGTIVVTTSTVGEWLKISVADNGHGMNEDTQSRIFDPYFTTKDIHEGTGLGMAMTYKVVTNHGGTIELDSTEGEGTNVTLSFPRAVNA